MAAHSHYKDSDPITDFKDHVGDTAFPCVGAKAALSRGQIEFCLAGDMRTSDSDAHVTFGLQEFAGRCSGQSLFVSFCVIFAQTPPLTEEEFERYLWERLQAMHDKDVQEFGWDNQVSSDPESPFFSLSIGGKAFYVVGLHPGASRLARRFAQPALVFNLHSQFELLRDQGSYARIRETILGRDLKLSGDYNPMLAQHGQSSEARQYSGRETGEAWKCPFHSHKGNVKDDA